MGDFELKFGHFVPDSAGIQEIFKGAGMQSALSSVAVPKAAEATSLASLHRTEKKPEYEGIVKVLDRTAVGVVKTANVYAYIDNEYHHTISKVSH